MTTGGRPRRLTRRTLCKQSVRISARGREPTPGGGRLHGQVALDTIFRDVLTGQRISDLEKVDGNGESLETPKTQATPDPETPDPETPDPETPDEQAPPPARRGLSRRQVLSALGIGAGALIAEQALVADGIPPTTAPAPEARPAPPEPGGY